jgi:hypothetical protein
MLVGTNPTLLLNVLPLALRGLQPAQLAAREDDTVSGTALVQELRDKLSMAVCAALLQHLAAPAWRKSTAYW